MTLKQFFQIAAGALISLLIYSLPLMGIIKWPLIIVFTLLGIALAFLPFQDRPLERWILAFFRSVYSPTLFTLDKSIAPKNFFQEETLIPQEQIIYPGGEVKLQEYLSSSPADKLSGGLEKIENSFFSRLSSLFSTNQAASPSSPAPAAPQINKQPFTVPAQQPVAIPRTPPKLVLEETAPGKEPEPTITVSAAPSATPAPGMTAQKGVQFSIDAAPPNPPMNPNTLTGQVIDADRRIIEGAILEVRDSAGRPVRALKSNRLGHFMVVTPLQNGRYEIITDKEGFEFEPVAFDVTGTIIPPIAISGKGVES